MIKECNYCGTEFNGRRSDAKYCTAKCRNKASVQRRLDNHVDMNQGLYSNKNDDRISIGNSELDNLLDKALARRAQVSSPISKHDTVLLAEKDVTRGLSSELSEYRMKLYFLEEKLRDKELLVQDLKAKVETLESKVKNHDSSMWDKFIDNPESIALMFGQMKSMLPKPIPKIGAGIVNQQVDQKLTQVANEETTNNSALNDDSSAKLGSILGKIDKLAESDPDKYNQILSKIDEGIDNPILIKMLKINNNE